jgi:hypothetical protein
VTQIYLDHSLIFNEAILGRIIATRTSTITLNGLYPDMSLLLALIHKYLLVRTHSKYLHISTYTIRYSQLR